MEVKCIFLPCLIYPFGTDWPSSLQYKGVCNRTLLLRGSGRESPKEPQLRGFEIFFFIFMYSIAPIHCFQIWHLYFVAIILWLSGPAQLSFGVYYSPGRHQPSQFQTLQYRAVNSSSRMANRLNSSSKARQSSRTLLRFKD